MKSNVTSDLHVEHVTKTYPDGTTALQNISFHVNKGEAVALLGHNGSGKSTMFKCLSGFERPTSGSIYLQGTDLASLSRRSFKPVRKKLGMVFQHFHLVYNLSVFQNVLFGRMGHHRSILPVMAPFASSDNRDRAMMCLDRVGLAHLADRRSDQLSGGQQQRVAIARMLMQEPEIVLADEPIASLDPKAGREVMELLWDIVEEQSLTVVCILHQTEIAKNFADRIIGLHKGQIVLDTPASSISAGELDQLYYGSGRKAAHA
ncbi:phosphonate ABC transporter ATP-binding protein [Bacillus luteus]|uniref:Phosphonate ABC transporter ATP-binding protein n=2 Tax=Alkalicoccus luteus TaxID=1237094 RepID=A0A969TS12_9BACI|nr:phosphonate ABC transporter ATP-binding protein [Alkalicoccus luteus]